MGETLSALASLDIGDRFVETGWDPLRRGDAAVPDTRAARRGSPVAPHRLQACYLAAWIWSNTPPSAKWVFCACAQEPNAPLIVTSSTFGKRAMSAGSACAGLRGR